MRERLAGGATRPLLARVAEPDQQAKCDHHDSGANPRYGRVDDAPHQAVDDRQVVALTQEVRISGERSEQKDVQEDAVGDEVTGQRDDEGRQSEPCDQCALNQAEHCAGEKSGDDGRHPVPVGGGGLDELDRDRRADGADEPD